MRAEIVPVIGDVHTDGIAPGHNASAGGRADRGPSIESVEDDRILRQSVEVGGLYIGMAGESAVPVTLIIGHNEYDVRSVSGANRSEDAEKEEENFHQWVLLFEVKPVEVYEMLFAGICEGKTKIYEPVG